MLRVNRPERLSALGEVRLAAFDLDGTLLSDGKPLSERNREALRSLRARGIRTAAATGRDLAQLSAELQAEFDYSVSANGSLVQKGFGPEAERVALHPLSPAQQRACLRVTRQCGGAAFLFRFGLQAGTLRAVRRFMKIHGIRHSREGARLYSGNLLVCPFFTRRALEKSPCGKIQAFFFTEDKMLRAKEKLEARGDLEVLRMYGTELELTARGVTKAAGLSELLCSLGLEPAQLIAFGDSRNDYEMLAFAGFSAAMENGDAFLISEADFVAPEASLDGVASALEILFPDSPEGEKELAFYPPLL